MADITQHDIDAVFPKVAATVADSRGALSEAEFEQKGLVTDRGVAQLRAFLSEVPADRFRTPLKVAEIPRLFTAETFCKLVIRAQRSAPAPA